MNIKAVIFCNMAESKQVPQNFKYSSVYLRHSRKKCATQDLWKILRYESYYFSIAFPDSFSLCRLEL